MIKQKEQGFNTSLQMKYKHFTSISFDFEYFISQIFFWKEFRNYLCKNHLVADAFLFNAFKRTGGN